MFIDVMRSKVRPPSGGPCLIESKGADKNMALLTEGGPGRLGFYKHGPPDGGRPPTQLVGFGGEGPNSILPTKSRVHLVLYETEWKL